MRAKLIIIGNSIGVELPKALAERFGFEKEAELSVEKNGILITPVKKARQGWEESFETAKRNGEIPEKDMFGGFQNNFDETEWT